MTKEKIKVSVVIPTMNSGKIICKNVDLLKNFIEKLEIVKDYEIILAAQTSKDDTFNRIVNIQSDKIIPLFIKKCGKGIGLTKGIKKAKFPWILIIDDDLPYPFESIKKLFEKIDDYDVIIASRYAQRMKHKIPLIRRLASSVYLRLVKCLINIPQKDIQAGSKLIKIEVFEKMGYPKEIGYVWDTEMLFLANKGKFRVLEVPVEYIHKSNQLVISKIAPKMFMGVLRIAWRNIFDGKFRL